jgi:hypothetical protein
LLVTEKGSMEAVEDNEQSAPAPAVEGGMEAVEDNDQSAPAPAVEGSMEAVDDNEQSAPAPVVEGSIKDVEDNEQSAPVPAVEAAKPEMTRRKKRQEKVASLKRLEIQRESEKAVPAPVVEDAKQEIGEKVDSLKNQEVLRDDEKMADASTLAAPAGKAIKTEKSRRKMREASIRRHFSKHADREEEQPTVVQEEPVTPVSPRVVLKDERLRSSSTGRMTPLRRRTEVVPAAIARRREDLILRLSEKRRPETIAASDVLKSEQDGTSVELDRSVIQNPVEATFSEPDSSSSTQSKSLVERWNERKHKRISSATMIEKSGQVKDDADDSNAGQEMNDVNESISFDMRSVVDDPPEPIRIGAARVAVADDPSWDISRVHFSEFDLRAERGRNDELNMFDHASWAGTDASFSTALGFGGAEQADSRPEVTNFADEKKEKDPANVQPARQTIPVPMDDDTLDPLGWPVQQDELLNNMMEDVSDEKNTTTFEKADDDAENLLAGSSATIPEDSDNYEDMVTKEERINLYSNTDRDEMSESEDTDDEDVEDHVVDYESHSEEEEEDKVGSSSQVVSVEGEIEAFATFDVTASSATTVGSVEDDIKPFATFDVAASSAIEAAKPLDTDPPPRGKMLPPPPPPPGSKKKRAIPLLSPPPEEKFKKWEESKLKPSKHLQSSKAPKSGLPPLHVKIKEPIFAKVVDTQPSEHSTSFFLEEGMASSKSVDTKAQLHDSSQRNVEKVVGPSFDKTLSPASSAAVILDTDSSQRNFEKVVSPSFDKMLSPASSAAVIDDTDSSQRNFEKVVSSSFDKTLSPASSAAVIHDTKMAARVDLAISVAAMRFEEHVAQTSPKQDAALESPELSDMLKGGAFSTWESDKLTGSDVQISEERENTIRRLVDASSDLLGDEPDSKMLQNAGPSEAELVAWLLFDVLRDDRLSASMSQMEAESREESVAQMRFLLEDDKRFNLLCKYIFDGVGDARVESFALPKRPDPADARFLASNFVAFYSQVSKVTHVVSPFGDENPFFEAARQRKEPVLGKASGKVDSMQGFVFDHRSGAPDRIVEFAYLANHYLVEQNHSASRDPSHKEGSRSASFTAVNQLRKKASPTLSAAAPSVGRRFVFPDKGPSPFEETIREQAEIVSLVLDFLGDPVAVCRMKMVSKACYRYIDEHEHQIIRDAVRLGGLNANSRPAFWLWVTLQKGSQEPAGTSGGQRADHHGTYRSDLPSLERQGREGKWNHVIERDVSRAFGNLPPHKTGARLRTDSIVRALVTWGKSRTMRGVRGSVVPPAVSRTGSHDDDSDEVSLTPTDTVSDWGGVSPTGSFAASSFSGVNESSRVYRQHSSKEAADAEMALGGNALTDDMKRMLQDKLSCILNALAAVHQDVGYCQGMDYVVAHLLRILQETVRWQAARGELPRVIKSAPQLFYGTNLDDQEMAEVYAEIDRSLVVEETCFLVMDSLLTTYSLRHFYWPELRCLKTSCLVFEKLIQIKLPVLADHFEHHELNVGLFALGWFQTLFLYLPSMPSATVCHMWDIWLVERSFKIFFRVGTAILFLSQPILLNHELEGMMTYLNTFPDATLLNPDILIACALQIKVTNRMLMELEQEISTNL